MEERMIIASMAISANGNLVCQVSINGEQEGMQFCTSPLKALRYCFLLKSRTNIPISREAIESLVRLNSILKSLTTA